MPEPLGPALDEVAALLLDRDRLVKAVASGRRRGVAPPAWRRVELRPVEIKGIRRLQVVRYDERQAHTVNVGYGPGADHEVDDLMRTPFGSWHVATVEGTVQLRVTKRGEAQVYRGSAAAPRPRSLQHDRAKPRLLDADDALFRVLGASRDKQRQVEELLRALDPVLDVVEGLERVRVVDLGCGNAALTFAAYRYLTAKRGMDVSLTGVDTRADARERNTGLARDLGVEPAEFVAGTILDAPVDGADIVMALHACDTATDEALARAVRWRSPLVLAAPCCHHDVARQIRTADTPRPYGPLSRHGILRERYADVLTDALRATLLRLLGYRVEVIEFVPSVHTPRNVLLRAVHTDAPPDATLAADYRALTREWGVLPELERLLEREVREVLGVTR